jgi:hypothetical protein
MDSDSLHRSRPRTLGEVYEVTFDLDGHDLDGPEELDLQVLASGRDSHDLDDLQTQDRREWKGFEGPIKEAHRLEPGDLVLTNRGSAFLIARVPEHALNLMLGAGLTRLRVREGQEPWPAGLLRWYLFNVHASEKRDWTALNGQLRIRKDALEAIPFGRLGEFAGCFYEALSVIQNHRKQTQASLSEKEAFMLEGLCEVMSVNP